MNDGSDQVYHGQTLQYASHANILHVITCSKKIGKFMRIFWNEELKLASKSSH